MFVTYNSKFKVIVICINQKQLKDFNRKMAFPTLACSMNLDIFIMGMFLRIITELRMRLGENV